MFLKKVIFFVLFCLFVSSFYSPYLAFSQENNLTDNNGKYIEIIEKTNIFNKEQKIVGEFYPGTQLSIETIQDGKVYFQWDGDLAYIEEKSSQIISADIITYAQVSAQMGVPPEKFLTHNPTEVYADNSFKTPILKLAPEVEYSITKIDGENYSITLGNRAGIVRAATVEHINTSTELDQTVSEKNNTIQESAVAQAVATPQKAAAKQVAEAAQVTVENPSVKYATHVQNIGWQHTVSNGEMSGTKGQAKRLESIKISIDSVQGLSVKYSTHVQDIGWLNFVSDGKESGTTGKAKRLEAIKIALTGTKAGNYDIYYRVHAQDYGWMDWVENGEIAGTIGKAKRLEAIEIKIVKKDSPPPINPVPNEPEEASVAGPTIVYSTHVETYGWLDFVANGALSGTKGKAKRLEAIKINLKNVLYTGNIVYSTHVQDYGWLADVSNGKISGTSGQSKRLEAIKINLTGNIINHYDVYYRVHVQDYGWLGWARNGMKAGTEGRSKRLEAIEIKLVPKGQGEAVKEDTAFIQPLTVFLDPGHGGYDSGAVAGGYHEADLNLAVAKKVQSLLVNRGYIVYMSRTNDTSVELLDRPKMANNLAADIFVSIHTNATAAAVTSATGIESYYYEYDPAYPSKINTDMHNHPERILKSVTLTDLIQDNMISYTGANDRGTDGASFAVIREAAMPATLIEMGFINNPGDRQKLVTAFYQNQLAKAIADGITEYFQIY